MDVSSEATGGQATHHSPRTGSVGVEAVLSCHAHVRRRSTKLGPKNWLFIGCGGAGQKAPILYTIVENCRHLGIRQRRESGKRAHPAFRHDGERGGQLDAGQLAARSPRQAGPEGGLTQVPAKGNPKAVRTTLTQPLVAGDYGRSAVHLRSLVI